MSCVDSHEIIQVINLYGLAVDTQRWDLFDRIFTPDVSAHYSESAQWSDLATFKRDFAAFHDPFDTTQHVMSTHLVHVDGDKAQSFCNGSWRLMRLVDRQSLRQRDHPRREVRAQHHRA